MYQKITILIGCIVAIGLMIWSLTSYEEITYTNNNIDYRVEMYDLNDQIFTQTEDQIEEFKEGIGIIMLISMMLILFVKILFVVFSDNKLSMLVSVTVSSILYYSAFFIISLLFQEWLNNLLSMTLSVLGLIALLILAISEGSLLDDNRYDGLFNVRETVRNYLRSLDDYNRNIKKLIINYNNQIK
jgi:hypothetical protein